MIDRLDHKATALGVIAILLWSSFALLTTQARGIPPFELLALSFAVAFVLGLAVLALSGRLSELKQPLPPWSTAFGAIFLFHALYFFALTSAPPAQASLIVYLWPLFIVLLSSLRGPSDWRAWLPCVIGSLFGLAGTAIVVTGDTTIALRSSYLAGYLLAFGCACVWAGYSVFNRRFEKTPAGMLVGVCGAVALGGLVLHGLTENWVTPRGGQGLAIASLGAGPAGFAFFAWDYATKRGHMAYLGLLSYLAPLLSTVLLVLAGHVAATPALGLAASFIVGGALIPALAQLGSRRTAPSQAE